MRPIDGIYPVEVPATVEFRIDLNEAYILKKALADYWTKQPFGTKQEETVADMLEGFEFMHEVLRRDEMERLGRLNGN